jgi:RNA polymerase sigma-70 factor (ECF subfamily)
MRPIAARDRIEPRNDVHTVQRDTRWHGGVSDQADEGSARTRQSGELSRAGSGIEPVGSGQRRSVEPALAQAAQAAEDALLMEGQAAVEIPPFAEVFRTYSSFVWRVLLRLGVAESDVDDVAQEVFLGVHRNLSRFEGRCSLRTWVYGICHRRAVDYRRRASVRPELYSDDPPEQGVAADQEQGFALSQARQQLARVLDGLDEEKRTVFVLFDIEGVPMDEVAEIVGCPLQTAYSRLYAARRKVEATLARQRTERRSV